MCLSPRLNQPQPRLLAPTPALAPTLIGRLVGDRTCGPAAPNPTHKQDYEGINVEADERWVDHIEGGGGLTWTVAMRLMTAFVDRDPAHHIADYTWWWGPWGGNYQIRLYKAVGLVRFTSPSGYHGAVYCGAAYTQQQKQYEYAAAPAATEAAPAPAPAPAAVVA